MSTQSKLCLLRVKSLPLDKVKEQDNHIEN